ncbi:MAG TPA: O-antigen ligase family protein, partial [Pyrinomonadaceae bacterium]|nr:O-antigen ligase family protein [Pyrinomonadaceae bacterium]
ASVVAILLSGQRTAIFGTILGIAILILLGARSFANGLARVVLMCLPVVLVVAFVKPPTADDVWDKNENETVTAVLSHAQRGTLKPAGEDSLQIRFENWGQLLTEVIPYRPLGAGLGAGTLGEVRYAKSDELPPIDNTILVLAIACGIPGALLFMWILGRASWFSVVLARKASDESENSIVKRIVASLMLPLVLNSIFGLTFTIYSVAPIAWLLMGWISAEVKRMRTASEREIVEI